MAAVQKNANLVEFEKCCQTHIFLQNFALIQPRTSPLKICKLLQKFANFAESRRGSSSTCVSPPIPPPSLHAFVTDDFHWLHILGIDPAGTGLEILLRWVFTVRSWSLCSWGELAKRKPSVTRGHS